MVAFVLKHYCMNSDDNNFWTCVHFVLLQTLADSWLLVWVDFMPFGKDSMTSNDHQILT